MTTQKHKNHKETNIKEEKDEENYCKPNIYLKLPNWITCPDLFFGKTRESGKVAKVLEYIKELGRLEVVEKRENKQKEIIEILESMITSEMKQKTN